MPEGPEIIITTQYLKSKLKNKEVTSIKILSGNTKTKLKGFHQLDKEYPLSITAIDSKGKFMWIELTNNNNKKFYIMNTFGLTGEWGFYKQKHSKIQFKIKSKTDQKTYDLYFSDVRNFGTAIVTDDYDIVQQKIDKLAPDVLKTKLKDNDLVKMIKEFIENSKADLNVVKVFLNQEAIVSGIGNYLIAEILYDAKINPHRSLDDLSIIEIKRLAHSIRKIVKLAYYDNKTGYMTQFSDFLAKHKERIKNKIFPNYHPDIKLNEVFEFKVYGRNEDDNKNKIKRDKIVGDRSTYWAPDVQK